MDYSVPKELITRYNFNLAAMDEAGKLELYESYNVPNKLEIEWAREVIDSNINLISVNNSAIVIQSLIGKIYDISFYITDEQIVKLYDEIFKKVSSLEFDIESWCYGILYNIMLPNLSADKPQLIDILKKVSNRYKDMINNIDNVSYRDSERQKQINSVKFYDDLIEKYHR